MCVTSPFLVFFPLQLTVREFNKRLGHPKKRLIIYRVSKGMCRRQLRDLQCLAQVSGNVLRLRRPAGESGGYCQVPASHPLLLLILPAWKEPTWRYHLHIGKYMPNVSMTPQFWSFFSDFLDGKYILNYFSSLCLLSKQSPVCLSACQAGK